MKKYRKLKIAIITLMIVSFILGVSAVYIATTEKKEKDAKIEYITKCYEYDWEEDIEKYGHLTEEGAIAVALNSDDIDTIKSKIMKYNATIEIETRFIEDAEPWLSFFTHEEGIDDYLDVYINMDWKEAWHHPMERMLRINYYTGEIAGGRDTM